jgi:hypothetical protein
MIKALIMLLAMTVSGRESVSVYRVESIDLYRETIAPNSYAVEELCYGTSWFVTCNREHVPGHFAFTEVDKETSKGLERLQETVAQWNEQGGMR